MEELRYWSSKRVGRVGRLGRVRGGVGKGSERRGEESDRMGEERRGGGG